MRVGGGLKGKGKREGRRRRSALWRRWGRGGCSLFDWEGGGLVAILGERERVEGDGRAEWLVDGRGEEDEGGG